MLNLSLCQRGDVSFHLLVDRSLRLATCAFVCVCVCEIRHDLTLFSLCSPNVRVVPVDGRRGKREEGA